MKPYDDTYGTHCRCYGLAGMLHVFWPAPFLAITPGWVPYRTAFVFTTGLCEVAGAFGLMTQRLSRAAGVGLALYAICVYPANIKHAVDSLTAADASLLRWAYHGPRQLYRLLDRL